MPVRSIDVLICSVALRKESVDRNTMASPIAGAQSVALRKESVDRNLYASSDTVNAHESLSARRAWIEIGKLSRLIP